MRQDPGTSWSELMSPGRGASRTLWILGIGGVVLVAAVLVLAPLFQDLFASLGWRVADGRSSVVLTDPDGSAVLTPPQDWRVHGPSGSRLSLISPDDALTVEIDAHAIQTDAASLIEEALAGPDDSPATGGTTPAPSSETLASGLTVMHATEGSRLIAVVEAGVKLRFTAQTADGASLDRYRPAIAELLETVGAQ